MATKDEQQTTATHASLIKGLAKDAYERLHVLLNGNEKEAIERVELQGFTADDYEAANELYNKVYRELMTEGSASLIATRYAHIVDDRTALGLFLDHADIDLENEEAAAKCWAILRDFILEINERNKLAIYNVMDAEEAAATWGVSMSHVNTLCASGKVKARTLGRFWIIEKDQPNPRRYAETTRKKDNE